MTINKGKSKIVVCDKEWDFTVQIIKNDDTLDKEFKYLGSKVTRWEKQEGNKMQDRSNENKIQQLEAIVYN